MDRLVDLNLMKGVLIRKHKARRSAMGRVGWRLDCSGHSREQQEPIEAGGGKATSGLSFWRGYDHSNISLSEPKPSDFELVNFSLCVSHQIWSNSLQEP